MALRGGAGFEEIGCGFVRRRVGQWVVWRWWSMVCGRYFVFKKIKNKKFN
jgi:hypothetical protein